MTDQDYIDAAKALQNWFKSQDLPPGEAMVVAEVFIAKMILANAKDGVNVEEKIDLIATSVRHLTMMLLITP